MTLHAAKTTHYFRWVIGKFLGLAVIFLDSFLIKTWHFLNLLP